MEKYLGVKIVQAEPAWKDSHSGVIACYSKSSHPDRIAGREDGYKVVSKTVTNPGPRRKFLKKHTGKLKT